MSPAASQAFICLLTLSREAPVISPSWRWVIAIAAVVVVRRAALLRAFRREAQQRLGEALGQVEKKRVLDLLAGAAQAAAQHRHDAQRHVGIGAQHGEKVAALEHEQVAIGLRHRVGGARPAVEQGDLAEHLAGADDVEHGLAALGRGDADFHAALQHGHHRRALRALAENRLAAPRALQPRPRHQRRDRVRRQALEQPMPGENLAPVDIAHFVAAPSAPHSTGDRHRVPKSLRWPQP